MSPVKASHTARERARAELTREITEEARRQLAETGAQGLSLRAVARELGMVSSALYRYFPSRDDLLTALIIDAYNALGAAAEAAAGPDAGGGPGGLRPRVRWLAACHAIRDWALAHPHEYALIYGSPVPGYVAPPDTVAPASRVTTRLMWILIDATAAGRVLAADAQAPEDPEVGTAAAALAPIRSYLPPGIPAPLIQRALMVWTGLFGVISFELYGQLHQVVGEQPGDRDTFFAECIRRWLQFMNLG